MNLFEKELAAGFDELAAEAGTEDALSFKGVPLVGVFDEGPVDPLRTDTKVGPAPVRLRLVISRAALSELPAMPKVGDAFDFGAGKLSIKDVEDVDPTDPTIAFIVKRV